jgi:hypothetical protein
MKTKLFLLALLLPLSLALQAQDIIVKRDGSTIISKVMEINKTDVKYKKFSNLNGPTYTIEKAEIMAINYENGDKDTFEAPKATETPKVAESPKKAVNTIPLPDEKNAELLQLYNREHALSPRFKINEKRAKYGCFIMGVSDNSTLSNQDIEIRFVQKPHEEFSEGHKDGASNQWGNGPIIRRFYLTNYYEVWVCNKSEHTIYVDMANTFRITADGNSESYYDPTQTILSKGNSVGGSVGLGGVVGGALGGVSIGSSSSSSVSETYIQQRVKAIPPKGSMPLATFLDKVISGRRWKRMSESEKCLFVFSKGEGPAVTNGNYITYTPETAPFKSTFTVRYAHDENFTSSSTATAQLYMKQLYGLKDNMEVWTGSKDKGGVMKAIKEDIPDYDDYTIVGHWWER